MGQIVRLLPVPQPLLLQCVGKWPKRYGRPHKAVRDADCREKSQEFDPECIIESELKDDPDACKNHEPEHQAHPLQERTACRFPVVRGSHEARLDRRHPARKGRDRAYLARRTGRPLEARATGITQ